MSTVNIYTSFWGLNNLPLFSNVSQPFVFCSVDRNKYQIHIPLPPKIDPTVTMMQVEEKPDVTYSDVGGCKEQIEKLREVVETPLLHVSSAAVGMVEYKL